MNNPFLSSQQEEVKGLRKGWSYGGQQMDDCRDSP